MVYTYLGGQRVLQAAISAWKRAIYRTVLFQQLTTKPKYGSIFQKGIVRVLQLAIDCKLKRALTAQVDMLLSLTCKILIVVLPECVGNCEVVLEDPTASLIPAPQGGREGGWVGG